MLQVLTLLLMLVLSGCGSGNLLIDVDLPANQASPFVELNNAAISTSSGIFFQFDLLNVNPTSINDTDASASPIFFPDPSSPFPANQTSYDLSEVDLEDDRAYRVFMFGTLDPGGAAKYAGVGDCPLTKRLGKQNSVTICFGLNGSTPVCAEKVAFSNCPR